MRLKFNILLLTTICLFSGFVPPETTFFHEGISVEIPENWKVKESGNAEGWPFVVLQKKGIGYATTVTIKWIDQTLDLDYIIDKHTDELEYKYSQSQEEFSYKILEGVYQSKNALKVKYTLPDNMTPYEGTIYCFHYCERTFLYTEHQATADRAKNSEGLFHISSSLSCVEKSDE